MISPPAPPHTMATPAQWVDIPRGRKEGYNRPQLVFFDRRYGDHLLLARKSPEDIRTFNHESSVDFGSSSCVVYRIPKTIYDPLAKIDEFLVKTFLALVTEQENVTQEEVNAAFYLRHVIDHALYNLTEAHEDIVDQNLDHPFDLLEIEDTDLKNAIKNATEGMPYQTGVVTCKAKLYDTLANLLSLAMPLPGADFGIFLNSLTPAHSKGTELSGAIVRLIEKQAQILSGVKNAIKLAHLALGDQPPQNMLTMRYSSSSNTSVTTSTGSNTRRRSTARVPSSRRNGDRQKDTGPHSAEAVTPAPTTPKNKTKTPEKRPKAIETNKYICQICANQVRFYSLSACNHRICHVCAIRHRALSKNKECTFCKVPQTTLIFTSDPDKPFESYDTRTMPFSDVRLSVIFETREVMEETLTLLRYNCPSGGCGFVAIGWADLKWHVRNKHGKVMCNICIRNKKVFSHELTLYTNAALAQHIPSLARHTSTKGRDSEAGPSDAHPMCNICQECFYNYDGLSRHNREKHEGTHVSDPGDRP